nr:unnamed protein product [Callosobruchus chinensis]
MKLTCLSPDRAYCCLSCRTPNKSSSNWSPQVT